MDSVTPAYGKVTYLAWLRSELHLSRQRTTDHEDEILDLRRLRESIAARRAFERVEDQQLPSATTSPASENENIADGQRTHLAASSPSESQAASESVLVPRMDTQAPSANRETSTRRADDHSTPPRPITPLGFTPKARASAGFVPRNSGHSSSVVTPRRVEPLSTVNLQRPRQTRSDRETSAAAHRPSTPRGVSSPALRYRGDPPSVSASASISRSRPTEFTETAQRSSAVQRREQSTQAEPVGVPAKATAISSTTTDDLPPPRHVETAVVTIPREQTPVVEECVWIEFVSDLMNRKVAEPRVGDRAVIARVRDGDGSQWQEHSVHWVASGADGETWEYVGDEFSLRLDCRLANRFIGATVRLTSPDCPEGQDFYATCTLPVLEFEPSSIRSLLPKGSVSNALTFAAVVDELDSLPVVVKWCRSSRGVLVASEVDGRALVVLAGEGCDMQLNEDGSALLLTLEHLQTVISLRPLALMEADESIRIPRWLLPMYIVERVT
jgi:hypothetical protein